MSKNLARMIALLTAFVLIVSLFACGEGNTTSTEDGALNKITNDSGAPIGYERRYHNDNGDITRLDVYDKDENYDHYILYEYDDNNHLIKETTYRADGIGDYGYEYTYDENGIMTEKLYFTMTKGSERTLYNEKGYAVERYTYDPEDRLIKHELCVNGIWQDAPVEETAASEAETHTE